MKDKENLNVKVQEEILEPIPEMSEEKVVSKIMEEGEILTEWEPMQGIGISPMAATIPVTSVTLSTNTLELKTSQTYQLKATLCPTCPTNKDLTWTSLNPDVATVNSSGLVTAKKPGGASIRLVAAGGGDPTSCFVTVVPMPVTRVEICGKPLTVKLDGSYTPTACVYPTNAYDKGVTWSLNKTTDIITIGSSSGTISAKKSGGASIKVTTKDGGHTDTCNVGVTYCTTDTYLSTEEMKINAQYILNKLRNKGWTKNAVCGMLGNLEVESKINPGMWQGRNVNNMNGGFGLVQWTPATKYIDWAKSQSLDYYDIDSQLARIQYEIDNNVQWINSKMTFKQFIKSTESAYDLAILFENSYERAKSPNLTLRGNNAKYWYDNLV